MSSVYHPYFRGKQFELLTIRENVELLLSSNFCPIIEPVNASLSGLSRAIEALNAHRVPCILIANPKCTSESIHSQEDIVSVAHGFSSDDGGVQIGILMNEESKLDEFSQISSIAGRSIAIIHDGFLDGKGLAAVAREAQVSTNVFIESSCGKLYRRHFQDTSRILIRDGFRKRPKNSAYPPFEEFSDLHLLYQEDQMAGFGDYLIAGKEFSEGGGPAWAVAIHVTVIDSQDEDKMKIHHFISDSNSTSTNPAGKFMEALEKLVSGVNSPNTKILRTAAITEFLDLHTSQHFPGLGYVKKLAMAHHLETMSEFLGR